MATKSSRYTGLFIVFFIVLCFFEAYNMIYTVYESFNAVLAILRTLIVLFACYSFARNPYFYKNSLLKCFFIWTFFLWFLCLVGNGGSERSAPVRIVIYQATYFIAYFCSRYSNKSEKVATFGFTALLIIASYYMVQNNVIVFSGEEGQYSISNLVFWALCSVPGILLIKKDILRNFLLILALLACVYGIKRSAMIAIAVILIVYVLSMITVKGSSKRFKRVLLILIAVIICAIILRDYFSELLSINFDRLNSISEDHGSGRTKVWQDTLSAISQGNFLEWLIGSGVGSTFTRAHHTSAHNDFLTILLEFGIVGIIFYIIFWIHILKNLFYLKKTKSDYFLPWFAAFVILAVVGSVGDLFTSYSYFPLVTAALGMMDSKIFLHKINKRYSDTKNIVL